MNEFKIKNGLIDRPMTATFAYTTASWVKVLHLPNKQYTITRAGQIQLLIWGSKQLFGQ